MADQKRSKHGPIYGKRLFVLLDCESQKPLLTIYRWSDGGVT